MYHTKMSHTSPLCGTNHYHRWGCGNSEPLHLARRESHNQSMG